MKNMKKSLSALLILVVVFGVVSVVNSVSAIQGGDTGGTNSLGITVPPCPTDKEPGCNTPLNVGSLDQVKTAGLSVNGFTAYSDSKFHQDVTLSELSADSNDRTVCADNSGKLVFCNPPGQMKVSASYNLDLFVSGVQGFNQQVATSTGNKNIYGQHDAFTGAISFQPTWDKNLGLPPDGVDVELTQNGAEKDCLLLMNSDYYKYNEGSSQTLSFLSFTFAQSDAITVEANSAGSCAPRNPHS